MSFRSWLFVFALGIGFAGLLQAQEQADPSQNRGETESTANDLSFSIPVRIIENNEGTDSAKRSEEERTQREKDDLIAQQGMNTATQSMNKATQSMKWAAWWSFGAVSFGTALLIWTLSLTRQANQAARDAVTVTREIGEAQARAYLSISDVSAGVGITNGLALWNLSVSVKNSGQSPALKVTVPSRMIT